VYEIWKQWARSLGVSLTVVAATPSPASADAVPPIEHVDGRSFEHFHVTWHPAPRPRTWGLDAGSLAMCAVARRTPLGPCPAAVRVAVPFREVLSILDTRRYQMERNSDELLAREIQEIARLRLLHTRIDMLYGVEGEPEEQYRLRREAFVFLATLSGDSRVLTAARGMGPSSSIRQFSEIDAARLWSRWATYVQVEEVMGTAALSTTLLQEMRYASLGASLFMVGSISHSFLVKAMGHNSDMLAIHPQPWPPGVTIRGSFR
jgi:hypothetical protein